MTTHHAGLSPALAETIAGLTAGSVATLVVHPLDIVKTRMQLHRGGSSSSSSSSSAPTTPARFSTVAVLRALGRNPQPLRSLYRGLTPNLLGNATSWASFFFFKARIEAALLALRNQDAPPAPPAALTASDYFVASGLAGVGVQCLTNPIWVLKTRMLSSDRGEAGAYPSMWSGAARLWRAEGLRGFYRGLGISLLGVSHGAVQFAVYDPLKRLYFARRRKQQQQQQQQDAPGGREGTEPMRMSNEATLVISSVAKLAAGAVTYPYQVIRSRLQNYDADERFGRGIRAVVGRTWREEGIRGFYRGIMPGVVRVLPATWVTFLVYENVKFQLM